MSKHSIRACVIVNPRSGGGGVNLSEALHVLAANRWKVDIREKPHKYEFSVVPRAVTVLVPNTYDGELLESGSLRTSEHALNGKAHKGKHKKHKKG